MTPYILHPGSTESSKGGKELQFAGVIRQIQSNLFSEINVPVLKGRQHTLYCKLPLTHISARVDKKQQNLTRTGKNRQFTGIMLPREGIDLILLKVNTEGWLILLLFITLK